MKTNKLQYSDIIHFFSSWKQRFHDAPKKAALILCGLLAGNLALAEPVNLIWIPFTNNAPAITQMPSDTDLGGVSAALTMYNLSGTAADLAGANGSGVNGLISGAAALAIEPQGGTEPANTSGAADSVIDSNDVALAVGTVTNFILTMWINQVAQVPATIGPRLFVLNPGNPAGDTGVPTSPGATNALGVKFQNNGQLNFAINANSALGTAHAAYPANKWLFFAWVYDGNNIYEYDGSDTALSALVSTVSDPNQSIPLTNSVSLIVGNRAIKSNRGFAGWIEDFRLYNGVSTNNLRFIENIRKAIAPKIPTITGIYPDGTALMQATNTLTFTASSSDGLNLTNIDLKVNGVDVSSSCTFVTNGTAGTSTNVSVSYTGLPQQSINTALMSATDAIGLNGSASVPFDTFSPTNFIIKAEEFDFTNGMFIDNPDYTDTNGDPNSYYGDGSVEEVDTHKGPTVGDNANDYRYDGDLPAGSDTQTPAATGELPSPTRFGSNAVPNHIISDWSSGEWQNYTKTFPAGNYNVWARLSTSSGSTVNFDQVTSGRGQTNQTTSRLGQFTFSGSGFQWVELMQNGSPAVVNLGGVSTVRATTGGGASADFYMLVAANPNLPIISNVNPNGAFLFQYTNKLTFTASSTVTTINTANIIVTLNGSNVSSSVTYSGGPSTWNATYTGLLPNQTYAVTIQVTDANNNTANAQVSIDTWEPVLQFEAEDFDFDPNFSPDPNGTGLRFIDNPVPTSVPTPLGTYAITATNSYEGQKGDDAATGAPLAAGIDQAGVGAGTRPYRPGDVGMSVVVDTPRVQFAHNQDFNIGFLGAGFWENYTRTWPSGTYNLYGRMASGASASGLPTPPGIRDDVDSILSGYGTTNQIISYLGTFTIPTTNGYSSYLYIPLIDRFGNYAQLHLSGVETLRSTLDLNTTAGLAQFGLNVNFYMLLPARTDQARIDAVYPDGTALEQGTNTLSFIASSPTYGINTTNIQVTLNGVSVSSGLVFSGSSTSWNVSYPGLQPNSAYTAVITVTDNDGQTHSTTVTFDTFNPTNFTWEAEDFDFDPGNSPDPNGTGLRFIDNPAPTAAPATNSYYGQTGDLDVDYSSAFLNVVPIPAVYRSSTQNLNNVIPIEVTGDAQRARTSNAQMQQGDPYIQDYEIFNLTNNTAPAPSTAGWINYTRTFPAGNYYVFARLSAGGTSNITLQCAQVTNGAGTSTQTTNVLGYFQALGNSYGTYQYAPLMNTNTGQHVLLSPGGVKTLQVTGDGFERVNFFMLVPPSAVSLTAHISGANVALTFPTQSGFQYIVSYKNNLTDPTWTPLGAAVNGTGLIQTVTDPLGSHRFYILTIQ